MISLRETARRHGIDKGQLSRDVHAGKEESGGYAICKYAQFDTSGRICGFEFPPDYVFPHEETRANSSDEASTTGSETPETGSVEHNVDAGVEGSTPSNGDAWARAFETGLGSGAFTRMVQTTSIADTSRHVLNTALTAKTSQAEMFVDGLAQILIAGVPLLIGGAIGHECAKEIQNGENTGVAKVACTFAGLSIGAFLGFQGLQMYRNPGKGQGLQSSKAASTPYNVEQAAGDGSTLSLSSLNVNSE